MKKFVFNPTVIFFVFILLLSWGCKRHISPENEVKPVPVHIKTGIRTNPFSLRNIMKAQDTLVARSGQSGRLAVQAVTSYPAFVYFRINPANFAAGQFKYLAADTSCTLMEIPFGDGALYGDSTLTEASAELLKDGYLYGMAPVGDSLLTKLQAMSNLSFQRLDTIVLPPDSSVSLQRVALEQAGYDARLFGLCLFKRPHGYVRYADAELGREEPVRGMKVWSLVFGIPVSTYTDANGYYEINYRFSLGSIMGTEAVNSRVTIRPLDTNGTFVGNILRILGQFAAGSKKLYGWVSSCNMDRGQNFVYTEHSQAKFWSQILNAYYFSDQYFTQEGIHKAPDKMVCYAHWTNADDMGNASTPMFGHINYSAQFMESVLNGLFGTNVNLSTSAPNLFNVLTSALPDMTIPVTVKESTMPYYNSRLAQLVFHELGHASFFRQVGLNWYTQMSTLELTSGVTGNPYGDGSKETSANYVGIGESWAQFIGMNFALRRYPLGKCRLTNPSTGILNNMSWLIENEEYYFQYNWIPYGMYHDLIDPFSNAPTESFDNVSGVSIQKMFNAFQPNITTWCGYFSEFVKNNTVVGIWSVFDHYYVKSCSTRFRNAEINRNFTKNDCSIPPGSSVKVFVPQGMFFSTISQLDADRQAEAYAQQLANQQGTCPCAVNCSTVDKKCLNGGCETGVKEYYKSERLKDGTYACYWRYRFSDGTTQGSFIEKGNRDCLAD